MILTRALWLSLLQIIVHSHPSFILLCTSPAMWSSLWIPALCCSWEVTSQHLGAHSHGDAISWAPPLLSWFHRHCPSPSFQQLLWAPGSCQKSFSSQSPTGASQWQPGKQMPRDGVQPMSHTHNCTLPGGKVHSESMNVSIFNLSGRKRGAKQPLLKQCLNITQILCAALPTQCGAKVNINLLSITRL